MSKTLSSELFEKLVLLFEERKLRFEDEFDFDVVVDLLFEDFNELTKRHILTSISSVHSWFSTLIASQKNSSVLYWVLLMVAMDVKKKKKKIG